MPRARHLGASTRRAIRDPAWARRQLRRVGRDVVLRVRHRGDHVAYYRAVMQDDVARGDVTAVGRSQRRAWRRAGRLQFDFLVAHGLQRGHRMLELGCGNLRAGRHFIRFLRPGHYYGVDISPGVVLAAQRTVADHGLQDKLPHLTVVDDMQLAFLPDGRFDVVHAHSVFSHTPLDLIEECFATVDRLLTPDGFFDFTFNRTEGRERATLGEDFYYRTETLLAAARRHGLDGALMDDWERTGHVQSKIRLRRAVAGPPAGPATGG